MKVYVIMGNDFPDNTVYADKEEAEQVCAKRMTEQRRGLKSFDRARIYWRVYECDFKVKGVEP